MGSSAWVRIGLVVIACGLSSDALACACCADVGDRFVERVAIAQPEREIIDAIRFASVAEVAIASGSPEDVEGIGFQSLPLRMKVERVGDEWTFTLDDLVGNIGRLFFTLPSSVTRFEVDPHDPMARDHAAGGIMLYKEWRLTTKAVGDGMLNGSVGGDQMATLILHGRGSHCAMIADFNAWSLVLYGARAEVELFGSLDP